MELTDVGELIRVLKENGLYAKKHLGQNFLVSENILKKIIDTADIGKNDEIIEVGPGLGVLTKELLKKAKKVTSIELDETLIPVLNKNLGENKKLKILHMDALKFEPPKDPYKVVANIPYVITSPLIRHFLQRDFRPKDLTLLVQYEVAEKITALEPKMTLLSLMTALFGEAKLVKKVPSGCFFPEPKVDSAILKISVYDKGHEKYLKTADAIKIIKIAKAAFSGRRKKMKNTIPKEYRDKTDIDMNLRPETLSVDEWKKFL